MPWSEEQLRKLGYSKGKDGAWAKQSDNRISVSVARQEKQQDADAGQADYKAVVSGADKRPVGTLACIIEIGYPDRRRRDNGNIAETIHDMLVATRGRLLADFESHATDGGSV